MMILSPEMFELYSREVMKDLVPIPDGQLRVMHYPQIPCKGFELRVTTIADAKTIAEILATYDLFLLDQKHRSDFYNMTSIQVWDTDCPDDDGSCWIDLDESEQLEVQKCGGYAEYKKQYGHSS
jgi:hypothetical protein